MERIAGCPNLRDMGGIKVKNGYVKPGRLIRSGALWRLEDKDIEKLGSIAAVYDMRSENERAYHPDPEIPGAEYIHIPITENGRRRFVQSKRTLPDKVEDMLEGYRCSEPASAQRMREVYIWLLKTLMQRARAGIVQPFISEVSSVQEGSLLQVQLYLRPWFRLCPGTFNLHKYGYIVKFYVHRSVRRPYFLRK